MTDLVFFPEALDEYEAAVVYYERQEEDLGARLVQEFDQATALLLEFPRAAPLVPEAPAEYASRLPAKGGRRQVPRDDEVSGSGSFSLACDSPGPEIFSDLALHFAGVESKLRLPFGTTNLRAEVSFSSEKVVQIISPLRAVSRD